MTTPSNAAYRKRVLADRRAQIHRELGTKCSFLRERADGEKIRCHAYSTQIGFYRLPFHPELFLFDEYARNPDLVPREILENPDIDDTDIDPNPRRYWRLSKSWGVSQERFEAELRRSAALCVYHFNAIRSIAERPLHVKIPDDPAPPSGDTISPRELRARIEPMPPVLAFSRIDPELNIHAAETLAAQRALLDSIGATYRL